MTGKAIHHILTSDTDVSTLIGSKVFPLRAKQGTTLPYVVYFDVSNTDDFQCIGGSSNILTVRNQISVFAASYDSVRTIARKVRKALNTTGIFAGVKIDQVQFVIGRDLYEDDGNTFHHSLEFILHIENI